MDHVLYVEVTTTMPKSIHVVHVVHFIQHVAIIQKNMRHQNYLIINRVHIASIHVLVEVVQKVLNSRVLNVA